MKHVKIMDPNIHQLFINLWISWAQKSQLPCLLELAEQSVIGPQGEVQRPSCVVLWVGLEVLDDISEEVGSLHTTARGLVAQLGEVDMEVVVGRLVVQVHSQLTGWEVVLLQDGLLSHNKSDIINLYKYHLCSITYRGSLFSTSGS